MNKWWITVKRLLVHIGQRFAADGCLNSAAALTYTTLFAVVPLMTVTYSMFAAIPAFQDVGGQIQSFIFSNFLPNTGDKVQQYLMQFSEQARSLTVVGVVFLIITAFMMLRTIEGALNAIWHVKQSRRGMASFLLYWAILSLGPILLGAGFILSSYLTSLKLFNDATSLLGGEQIIFRVAPLLLSTAAFCLIYMAVPNSPVRFKHALIGSGIVALLFEIAKQGFAFFVTLTPTYQLIYGAFAAVPIFLLWIYLSWVLVLLGAELIRALGVLEEVTRQQTIPKTIGMLMVLATFWRQFQYGVPAELRDVRAMGWGMALEDWEQYTNYLLIKGIITKDENNELILARDLAELELWPFIQELPWALPNNHELTLLKPDQRPPWAKLLIEKLDNINQAAANQLSGSVAELISQQNINEPIVRNIQKLT
ncbi:virulence factor BrkB family protein [Spartinivicinus ruber]|uniref:virulence factor BrkB family protein n=1 Tax=Spartinivicinus ruber TaxID=2683272 RepID=UPI0013D30DC0|nr:virulence factor BrkB family protein [Spartinivicinus ruber]